MGGRRSQADQPLLPFEQPPGEDPRYLSDQLVTYIGNKRSLLDPIRDAVELAQSHLGGRKMRVLDAFSGSGVVSRLLRRYSRELVVNDIEDYARVVSSCYLTNRSDYPEALVLEEVRRLNNEVLDEGHGEGFIQRLYSPNREEQITVEDRVFYTRENARRLDRYRSLIGDLPTSIQNLLLGPLLSKASIHANTAGVFKGFYKDRQSGIGRFGGTGRDALTRILAPITLEPPVLSQYECDVEVFQMDANLLVDKVGEFDLAYLDPPYNQHPYGSNYFMLNLLVNYEEPTEISRVSGIPVDWRRSDYNVRSRALDRLTSLVSSIDARFVLISYNDEGFISPVEMRRMLESVGTTNEFQLRYATYRGSRNLRDRSIHVTEHLFLVDRHGEVRGVGQKA